LPSVTIDEQLWSNTRLKWHQISIIIPQESSLSTVISHQYLFFINHDSISLIIIFNNHQPSTFTKLNHQSIIFFILIILIGHKKLKQIIKIAENEDVIHSKKLMVGC
jgi:hypothetical protein